MVPGLEPRSVGLKCVLPALPPTAHKGKCLFYALLFGVSFIDTVHFNIDKSPNIAKEQKAADRIH